MVLADDQPFSEMVLPKVVWKTMTLKPNSFETSKYIQRIFSGLWCTRVEDWLKASWIFKKEVSSRDVENPSFVLEV